MLLGSGETSPGMTKIHRKLLSEIGKVRAVNIDTPYGFQQNVNEMTQKLVDYFNISLQVKLEPLDFKNYEELSPVQREVFRQKLRNSNYIFSGPGSPTYALAQWKPLNLGSELYEVLEDGGTVCFSSAAVLTLGSHTAPIYEIYKAGSPLYWLEGLGLMQKLGLDCVVIPHFNNAEGGNYDTSACYLGQKRLGELESMLPTNTATFGIDEHTSVLINLEEQTLFVEGRANAYWRHRGTIKTIHAGEKVLLSDLQNSVPKIQIASEAASTETFSSDIRLLIEQISPQSDLAIKAVAALVRLAEHGGDGFLEPTPLINALIEIRSDARSAGDYGLSDKIRDALNASSVEVTDSPDGITWRIKKSL